MSRSMRVGGGLCGSAGVRRRVSGCIRVGR